MTDEAHASITKAHEEFLAIVETIRPELHRYCARLTGSVIEGEDIVQDTLAHAYYELPELKEFPAMRSWLFRNSLRPSSCTTEITRRSISSPNDTMATD